MTLDLTVEDAVTRLAAQLGGSEAARLAASALIEAELIGQPRFGLDLLAELEPIKAPAQDSATASAMSWESAAGRFAPLAIAEAALSLQSRAEQHGMAATFLRGVRGFGRLAPFVRVVANQGLVAIAGAEGPPFVAPDGGGRPVIGTNPLAFAVGQGEDQIVIDAATSLATMAEVKTARAEGRSLPHGVALDASGHATVSPADVAALLPRGGRIGSLIGLIVELLAGVVGQGRGDPAGRGVFFIAIDPKAAGGETVWLSKLAALKADWQAGGGHWPSGRRVAPVAALPIALAARFQESLGRIADRKERP